ncbi:hypothetical protein EDC01DRAFT_683330 [Geopyxis carbonaria]|nr:hypothetical protein EDC01DRAFT_683330 [Geopyxis carbonaria]
MKVRRSMLTSSVETWTPSPAVTVVLEVIRCCAVLVLANFGLYCWCHGTYHCSPKKRLEKNTQVRPIPCNILGNA